MQSRKDRMHIDGYLDEETMNFQIASDDDSIRVDDGIFCHFSSAVSR